MRDFEPYYTEDGSIGLYSFADKDVYHSKYGALTEAWEKFILPSGINALLKYHNNIKILDVCYGIGYNTKALMSYVVDYYSEELKNKSLISKLFNIVSIHTNKIIKNFNKKLLRHNDAIYDDNLNNYNLVDETLTNKISIDCLDINEELIKLSPLFRTIKTPGEIFTEIVPNFLNCFETYYKAKNLFENILSNFYPKNKQKIKELLDIKFRNMHIDNEYKLNQIVNYILLNYLYIHFGNDYFNNDLIKIIKEKQFSKFLSKSLIKYAKFNHNWGYNESYKANLSTFLHNIYYRRLSKRYKNVNFKAAEKLFKINLYINDARKTITQLNVKYDCIFLDAFAYTKAPQLWSMEFIEKLSNLLSDSGVILTYSNSAQIRNTFLENNLFVGKIYNKKQDKFIGTIASKDKTKIKYPLTNYELGLCNTKAGIPYHDPNLSFTNKEILELREYEFRHSNLMSSSKYMKIRTLRGQNE